MGTVLSNTISEVLSRQTDTIQDLRTEIIRLQTELLQVKSKNDSLQRMNTRLVKALQETDAKNQALVSAYWSIRSVQFAKEKETITGGVPSEVNGPQR